jgi:hypothetical protein
MNRSVFVLAAGVLACSSSSAPPDTTATDAANNAAADVANNTTADADTPDASTSADVSTSDDAISTDSSTSDTTVAEAATGNCAFVGSWSLIKFECGASDITTDWKGIVAETTWLVTASAKGCHVLLTNKNAMCLEKEEFDWTIADNGSITAGAAAGVISCAPAMCIFTAGDAPCVPGDRSRDGGGASGAGSTLVKSGANIVISVTNAGGLCPGMLQRQTYSPL